MTPTQLESLWKEFDYKFMPLFVASLDGKDRTYKLIGDEVWQWFESKLEENNLVQEMVIGLQTQVLDLQGELSSRNDNLYNQGFKDGKKVASDLSKMTTEEILPRIALVLYELATAIGNGDIEMEWLKKDIELINELIKKPKYGKDMSGSVDGIKAETSPKSNKSEGKNGKD